MTLEQVARVHYATQAQVVEQTAAQAGSLWSQLDLAALSESWSVLRLGERLFVAVAAAQLALANLAGRYVAAALAQQGATSAPVGVLAPRMLAGVAADGRDLETLLLQPLITTKLAIRDGATPERAVEMGGSALGTIVESEVADAGRAAVETAMVADPAVTGWVRMLVPPSCGRCAILAGRRYRFSDGFQRHPRCDCVHIPAVEDEADDLRTDPRAYFESLSEAEQDRYFGKGRAEAIRLGADMNRTVNVGQRKAGLSTAGGRRGRNMPADLIKRADGDRDEAVRLLRRHGYLF